MSHGTYFTIEGESSQGVMFDLRALNAIDHPLTVGANESYFAHTFEPHIAFAQETFVQGFENLTFGRKDTVNVDKTFDYISSVSAHITLPGIVGRDRGSASTKFPTLVPDGNDGCAEDGFEGAGAGPSTIGQSTCLPLLERIEFQYEFDSVLTSADSATLGPPHLTGYKYAHWVYGVGYRIIERFGIKAGSLVAEEADFRWLYAWDELASPAAKKGGSEVGKWDTREELIKASLYEQELYVNIPLWFTHFYGNSLSIVRSQLARLVFTIETAAVDELIIVSDQHSSPVVTKAATSEGNEGFSYTANYGAANSNRVADGTTEITSARILDIEVLQQVIYLDDAHHDAELADAEDSELNVLAMVTESVSKTFTSMTANQKVTLKIEGVNPVMCIHVMCQLQANDYGNDWFNFSRIGHAGFDATVTGRGGTNYTISEAGAEHADVTATGIHDVRVDLPEAHPLKRISLEVNNQQRIKEGAAEQFLSYTSKLHHTSKPNAARGAYIYTIPIALFPEQAQRGSGSCNLGRVNHMGVGLIPHDNVAKTNIKLVVHAYVTIWTIWSYFGHTSGARFQTATALFNS